MKSIVFPAMLALLAACQPEKPASPMLFPEGSVLIGGQEIRAEIATSSEQHARGLMFRENLPQGRGMLFIFTPPREVSMWMKNTLIPLDMVFIAPGKTILRIARNTTPRSLAGIPAGGDVLAVLELPAGDAGRLSLAPGMPVSWTTALPDGPK